MISKLELPSYVIPELHEHTLCLLLKHIEKPMARDDAVREFRSSAEAFGWGTYTDVGAPGNQGQPATSKSKSSLELGAHLAFTCTLLEWRLGHDNPETLRARYLLTSYYSRINRVKAATTGLEQLVKDYSRVLGSDNHETLVIRRNLADCYRSVGYIQKAITESEQLVKDYKRVLGADHPETLLRRHETALMYGMVAHYDKAIDEIERIAKDLDIFHSSNYELALDCRQHLVILYCLVGRLQEALANSRLLVQECQRSIGPHDRRTLRARHDLAICYYNAGFIREAVAELESLSKDSQSQLGLVDEDTLAFRGSLASCYSAAGLTNKAIAELENILIDRGRIDDDVVNFLLRRELAVEYAKAGNLLAAEPILTKLVGEMERIRSTSGHALGRAMTSQFLTFSDTAICLAWVRAQLGRPAASVVEAIEQGTSRSLLDLLKRQAENGMELARRRVAEGYWSAERRDAYEADLNWLYEFQAREEYVIKAERMNGSGESPPNREELTLVCARLQEAEKELLPSALPRTLEEIRGSLRAGEQILLFGWSVLAVMLVLIPKDGEVTYFSLGKGENAKSRSDRVMGAIQAARQARDGLVGRKNLIEGAEASRAFLDFVLPRDVRSRLAAAQRVIVVPSGPLHEVPLDVLAEIARIPELVDKIVLTAPSASVFAMLRERGVGDGPFWPGIVGDPDFSAVPLPDLTPPESRSRSELDPFTRDGKLRPLPRAGLEAYMVAHYFRLHDPLCHPTLLVGAEATLSQVRAASKGKRVIHFAAHAELAALDNPLGSAIQLAPDEKSKLRVDMLLTQWTEQLKGCDLVVLSCCHTAGGVKLGDSLMGLPIGFFHAGARCVIASLWKVNDTATWFLMSRFYQNLLGTHHDHRQRKDETGRRVYGHFYGYGTSMPIAAALHEAKSWLRQLTLVQVTEMIGDSPNGATEQESNFITWCNAWRIRHPFAAPKYWAAFVVIGDDIQDLD